MTVSQELHNHLHTAMAMFAVGKQGEAEYHYIKACDLIKFLTDPIIHYTAWVRCEYVKNAIGLSEDDYV